MDIARQHRILEEEPLIGAAGDPIYRHMGADLLFRPFFGMIRIKRAVRDGVSDVNAAPGLTASEQAHDGAGNELVQPVGICQQVVLLVVPRCLVVKPPG